MKKTLIVALTLSALTGTAMADDPPAGGDAGGGGDASGGGGGDASGGGDATPAGGGGDAAAPAAGGKTKTLGADGVFVLPLGDYADASNAAIGAMGRFEFGLNPALAITVRAGLLYTLAKDPIDSILMIPVHAGAKYSIGTSGLFVQGELGLTHVRVSPGSVTRTKFSFEAGAGFQKGKLNARAGFYRIQDDTALQGIMASVGFDFVAM